MFPTFTSTAIDSIKQGSKADTVEVTFTGGKSYTYGVNDLTAFATEVTRLVNAKESVGSFVNKSIRSGLLTSVQVYYMGGSNPTHFLLFEVL